MFTVFTGLQVILYKRVKLNIMPAKTFFDTATSAQVAAF